MTAPGRRRSSASSQGDHWLALGRRANRLPFPSVSVVRAAAQTPHRSRYRADGHGVRAVATAHDVRTDDREAFLAALALASVGLVAMRRPRGRQSRHAARTEEGDHGLLATVRETDCRGRGGEELRRCTRQRGRRPTPRTPQADEPQHDGMRVASTTTTTIQGSRAAGVPTGVGNHPARNGQSTIHRLRPMRGKRIRGRGALPVPIPEIRAKRSPHDPRGGPTGDGNARHP